MRPPDDAIREQLERMLASGGFANADRMAEFLRYVVARALAGEGDQVKEYVIGLEVFKRDAEYDPRLDSIVRVEARRLRSKIDEYYAGPGREDTVLIGVPRGSYVPVFETREVAAAVAVAPPIVAAPPVVVSPRTGWRVGLGLAVVTIALVLLAAWRTGLWTANTGRGELTVAVLPFAEYSNDPADELFAAGLTDRVTSELARLHQVGVVSRTTTAQFGQPRRPLAEIGRALHADLVMEGSVARDGDMVRVDARLVDAATDRKVWVQDFVASSVDVGDLPRRIAVATATAATSRKHLQ
jgi:TolB-like protein